MKAQTISKAFPFETKGLQQVVAEQVADDFRTLAAEAAAEKAQAEANAMRGAAQGTVATQVGILIGNGNTCLGLVPVWDDGTGKLYSNPQEPENRAKMNALYYGAMPEAARKLIDTAPKFLSTEAKTEREKLVNMARKNVSRVIQGMAEKEGLLYVPSSRKDGRAYPIVRKRKASDPGPKSQEKEAKKGAGRAAKRDGETITVKRITDELARDSATQSAKYRAALVAFDATYRQYKGVGSTKAKKPSRTAQAKKK